MSKSKNWTAVVADTLISSDLTLTVAGEINTGGVHQHAELSKKIPQGILETQLILEAKPVSDSTPEVFVDVSYKEKVSGRYKYTSIKILVAGSEEVLKEISKDDIHQHYS